MAEENKGSFADGNAPGAGSSSVVQPSVAASVEADRGGQRVCYGSEAFAFHSSPHPRAHDWILLFAGLLRTPQLRGRKQPKTSIESQETIGLCIRGPLQAMLLVGWDRASVEREVWHQNHLVRYTRVMRQPNGKLDSCGGECIDGLYRPIADITMGLIT